MLSLLQSPSLLCDGIPRRELLRVGALGAAGISLPSLLHAADPASPEAGPPPGVVDDPTFGRAKNVIYLWLQGGPPQHETFDPKPDAPAEIRGPFKPIQTNVAGTQFCELLPRTARIADKLAVVRSLSTDNNIHSASGFHVLTGYPYRGPNARTITPDDWPWFGSIVKMLKPSEELPPLSAVWVPDMMRLNENVTPAGQTGGFLGRQWGPDRFIGDPADPAYEVDGLRTTDVTREHLARRQALLSELGGRFNTVDHGSAVVDYGRFQDRAFDLLTTDKVRNAFAVGKEPDKLRDRYGRTGWGQTVLLARRLIEAGVRLVHVNWVREPGDSAVDNPMWDTHAQNADRLEDVLCPIFDVGFTALIDDLDDRGLLDETLVVAIAEFGRTPKINALGGRDHWGPVFSFAMAGAGVTGGQVYGASDKNGGHPARDRVTPADVTATLFHLLGVHHESTFLDARRREHRVTTGEPIRAIIGSDKPKPAPAAPGGDVARVPPFDPALLLNADFSSSSLLYPLKQGSRPKGWRASQRPRGLSVVCETASDEGPFAGKSHVAIGLNGTAANSTDSNAQSSAAGESAILAQEMRSPRAGTFTFRVRIAGRGDQELYEKTFLPNFTCQLVIYQYKDETKNPVHRTEFASLTVRPKYAGVEPTAFETFELKKTLDSAAPGQNFAIGNGLGVAVVVENTSTHKIEIARGLSAGVAIDGVELEFDSRTINDDVKA